MIGDTDFEAFFKAHESRIHFQIHRLGITGENYGEFFSEGIVALWYSYKHFDVAKGNMGTFINYHIRFRLIDLLRGKLRDEEALENIVQEELVAIDHGNRNRSSGVPVVAQHGLKVRDKEFWEEVRGKLSENQWKWVQYFIIAEMSVQEIMELEGVSADAVKGWGQAVRRKLRDTELRQKLEGMLRSED